MCTLLNNDEIAVITLLVEKIFPLTWNPPMMELTPTHKPIYAVTKQNVNTKLDKKIEK